MTTTLRTCTGDTHPFVERVVLGRPYRVCPDCGRLAPTNRTS